ncbi:hypothetical protein V5T82_13160 [Magnetovibrio sp. PR-2]|uniref:hypothetical protein n=1 Tax=Magnetovibrio sp. PR-2 TaxID=3120356 RepID=UPI002FCE29EA
MFQQVGILRILVVLSAGVGLSGCLAAHSAFSKVSQQKGNAHCADLFNAPEFAVLKGKMPILPGELPTREMILSNAPISEEEGHAVKALEGAIRACHALRNTADMPTSATEEIVEQRLSNLRYGLFKGEIPFAVYNYGLAKALREQAKFRNSGVVAAEQGRKIGEQKTAQMVQQVQQQMRMNQLQNQLNAYNQNLYTYNQNISTYNANVNTLYNKTWTCSSSGSYSYSCY